MFKKYSDEQIQRAADTDLVDFLRMNGQQVKRVGTEYEWMDGDETVSIKDNLWFHQYERVGGTTISFVEKYFGLNFRDAVKLILNEDGTEEPSYINKKAQQKPKPITQIEFRLPESNNNMHRTFGYLINTRGIDSTILRIFAHNGLLYETKAHHNAVFVGKDKSGKPKHAHLRSTTSKHRWRGNQMGSDTRFSFNWRGKGNTVFVFEAPIDMLSYISMYPRNWYDNNYIAACSLSPQPLMQMLKDNPNLDHVYICYDNDGPGQKSAQQLCEQLKADGYKAEILVPTLKDWNEDLLNSGQEEGEIECPITSLS
ncbi:Toprim domain-containing protein [Ruminococcaceae bacterium R-25]|nr:Toprim domain-containing protein [Ruminococcaceae bacterium R-25]SUQ11029.1 Toprim-like [Oscillospiraceae bacterium]